VARKTCFHYSFTWTRIASRQFTIRMVVRSHHHSPVTSDIPYFRPSLSLPRQATRVAKCSNPSTHDHVLPTRTSPPTFLPIQALLPNNPTPNKAASSSPTGLHFCRRISCVGYLRTYCLRKVKLLGVDCGEGRRVKECWIWRRVALVIRHLQRKNRESVG
jgi:hypothetical protein